MAKQSKEQQTNNQDPMVNEIMRLKKQLAEKESENKKLREAQQGRPEGAFSLTGNVTFPKGTGRRHLGSIASQNIKLPNNMGMISLVHNPKKPGWYESTSGNITVRITGWLNPKLVKLTDEKAGAKTDVTELQETLSSIVLASK